MAIYYKMANVQILAGEQLVTQKGHLESNNAGGLMRGVVGGTGLICVADAENATKKWKRKT